MERIARFISDCSGASSAEYVLLVSLIAVGLISTLTSWFSSMSALFTFVGDKFPRP